jgi:hypothetical protein
MNTKNISILTLWAMLLLATAGAWGQDTVHEAPADRVPNKGEVAAKRTVEPVSLQWDWAFTTGRNVHALDLLGAAEVAAADQKAEEDFADVHPAPPRVGLVRPVGPAPLSAANGSAQSIFMAGLGDLWVMKVQSPGAFGLRIHFSNFDLGDGSLIVYAEDADGVVVRGPYTGRGPDRSGDFWTETLPGDTAVIEVSGAAEPRWEVAEIGHFDKDPAALFHAAKGSVSGVGPDPLDHHSPPTLACHQDVMCHSTNPLVTTIARDATVAMNLVQTGGTIHWCSGTILNDLDDETTVPYFLTAFHCVSTQAVADTMEIVYFWQRPLRPDGSCGGTLPNYANLPRTTGGTLLASSPTNTGNDMSFFRLNGELPGGTGLAGWTNAALPTNFVGIHHPRGDWKRVSFFHDQRVVTPCTNLPTNQYHYLLLDNGITEGGSSGSAIFDNGGRVMGQLYGTCSPPTPGFTPGCNNRNQFNVLYGRFAVTYPLIQRWLEIGGTIRVNRFFGGVEQGTPAQPFRTVTAAHNFAWNGARIKIQAASYPERPILSQGVTLLANGGTVTIGQ